MLDMNAVVPLRLAVELARRFWRGRTEENAVQSQHHQRLEHLGCLYLFQHRADGIPRPRRRSTCSPAIWPWKVKAFGLRANTVAPDAFPERVSTASVCDAIARVAAGDMNGRMLLLEASGVSVV
jgi:hypothetical protein